MSLWMVFNGIYLILSWVVLKTWVPLPRFWTVPLCLIKFRGDLNVLSVSSRRTNISLMNEGAGNGITHSLDSEEDLRPLNDYDPRVLPTIPWVLILPQIIYRCLMIAGTLGRAPTLINEPYLGGAGFPGDTVVMSSWTVPPLMWSVCLNWRDSLAVF